MQHVERKLITQRQCSYACLTGVPKEQMLCDVKTLFEGLEVCNGCRKQLSVIPEDCQGIFEESFRARMLVVQFTSGETNNPDDRPLTLVKYFDRRQSGSEYALRVGGDPDLYAYSAFEFSLGEEAGTLQMRMTPADLEEAEKSVPLGREFRRDLVEVLVGPISDEIFRAVKKALAMGFSYMSASVGVRNDSYSRLRLFKGHERRYTYPNGEVVVVPKGIGLTIEWSL